MISVLHSAAVGTVQAISASSALSPSSGVELDSDHQCKLGSEPCHHYAPVEIEQAVRAGRRNWRRVEERAFGRIPVGMDSPFMQVGSIMIWVTLLVYVVKFILM